jgi:gas vesicle protein
MNEHATPAHDYRFLAGLAVGGAIGAGLAIWLAPRAAAEIKALALDSARNLGNAASARYRDARSRVTGAVDGLTREGQGLRDDMCDTVIRTAQSVESGAQGVQQFAAGAKTRPEA